MNKIRVLVAHNDTNVTKEIVNVLQNLNYAEVVGVASDEEEAYKKIVQLQPEMVFTKCFDTSNKFGIIKKAQEQLKEETPRFNVVTEEQIPEDEIFETTRLVNDRLNVLIPNTNLNMVKDVMQDYYDYKNQ